MKYEISGPHGDFAAPYGKAIMHWQSWYVSRGDGARRIMRFKGKREFIINNTYPTKSFSSLERAVAWAKRSLRPKSKLSRFFCS